MHAPGRFSVLATLALASFSLAGARAETTVVKNFTLIDGTGAAAVPGSAMIFQDGRITWVGPVGSLRVPKNAVTVDFAGKYIIPGLIDLHVHLGNVLDLTQDPRFFTRENVEHDLRTYAAYGVTTVQSLGTDSNLIFTIRAEQRVGRPAMARVYTAGQGFVFKGGYGGLTGVNKPVGSVAEVDAAVAEQAAHGVDVIKLWLDDEHGTLPKMPPQISRAIIDSAHQHQLRAVAHVFYLEDAIRVVRQGVDGLAHSVRDQPVNQTLIDLMKQRGTWQFAATLSREACLFAYGEPKSILDDPFLADSASATALRALQAPVHRQAIAADPHWREKQQYLQTAQHNLIQLASAGVPFAVGTDSGPPGRFAGYFTHWELELMVQAGLTPAQVLRAATGEAARFLHATDLGTLQATKWADFIVLDADPLADIRNSRTIRAVYVAGKAVQAARPRA